MLGLDEGVLLTGRDIFSLRFVGIVYNHRLRDLAVLQSREIYDLTLTLNYKIYSKNT